MTITPESPSTLQVNDFTRIIKLTSDPVVRINGIVSVSKASIKASPDSLSITSLPGLKDSEEEDPKVIARRIRTLVSDNLQDGFHPNVVPILGLAFFDSFPCLVSPWWGNGDVRSYLILHPEADRLALTYDVSEGLLYLHERGIVHGDLKPSNILINDDGGAMIRGFGLADVLEDRANELYTPRYSAPELLSGAEPSFESDAYSLAAVTLFILTGLPPYASIKRDTAAVAAQCEAKLPSKEDYVDCPNFSEGLWSSLVQSMTPNPEDRASPAELVDAVVSTDPQADPVPSPRSFGPMVPSPSASSSSLMPMSTVAGTGSAFRTNNVSDDEQLPLDQPSLAPPTELQTPAPGSTPTQAQLRPAGASVPAAPVVPPQSVSQPSPPIAVPAPPTITLDRPKDAGRSQVITDLSSSIPTGLDRQAPPTFAAPRRSTPYSSVTEQVEVFTPPPRRPAAGSTPYPSITDQVEVFTPPPRRPAAGSTPYPSVTNQVEVFDERPITPFRRPTAGPSQYPSVTDQVEVFPQRSSSPARRPTSTGTPPRSRRGTMDTSIPLPAMSPKLAEALLGGPAVSPSLQSRVMEAAAPSPPGSSTSSPYIGPGGLINLDESADSVLKPKPRRRRTKRGDTLSPGTDSGADSPIPGPPAALPPLFENPRSIAPVTPPTVPRALIPTATPSPSGSSRSPPPMAPPSIVPRVPARTAPPPPPVQAEPAPSPQPLPSTPISQADASDPKSPAKRRRRKKTIFDGAADSAGSGSDVPGSGSR